VKILTAVLLSVYYYEFEDKKPRRLIFDHRPVPVEMVLVTVAVLQTSSEYLLYSVDRAS
jgi:hypothetical protein